MLWALVFPVCVVAAISISFSKDNQEIFKVGIYQPADQATHHFQLTDEVFIGTVEYQDFDKALERIRHHQLDMLFSATQPQRYWTTSAAPLRVCGGENRNRAALNRS